ncbi:leucine-rich repeat domain-containing protein [bacterium]
MKKLMAVWSVILLCVLALQSQDLSDLTLFVHYPLTSDNLDVTDQQGPMTLVNTPFQDGGIFCNGIYPDGDPAACNVFTPAIMDFNFKSFAVSAVFKVDSISEMRRPIFVCGKNDKWSSVFTDPDSTISLSQSSSFFNAHSSGTPFSSDTWHEITFTYDSTEGMGRLYLDGVAIDSSANPLDHGNDRAFSISHGSVGRTFKGYLKDLKIYSYMALQTDLEKDSLALVALYNSTDGPNWTDNSNWLTEPVDTWYGITVDEGRVTEVNLTKNNLDGFIPEEIGDLTGLTVLYLHNNQLNNTIPAQIGNLINLNRLFLSNNQLDGSIPGELGNLVNLTSLYLQYNLLTNSLPPQLADMSSLLQLWVDHNQLTGSIPTELGDFEKLNVLSLGENQFIGSIPAEIGNISSLTQLDLSDNQLTGAIPTELGNLTNLTRLNLSNNQLDGFIPPDLGDLMKLNLLAVGQNQLTGPVPAQLWNLTNLVNLNLRDNQLTGSISSEISGLINLALLFIQNNALTDLPDLSTLVNLKRLEMENNRFVFDDIEPNLWISDLTYSPQDSVGEEQNVKVIEDSDVTLSVDVDGANNVYQWYKDGTLLSDASSSQYTIDPVLPTDIGSYSCEITNTLATQLTLYHRPLNVILIDAMEQDSLALVALYDSTDGLNWTDNSNWLTGPLNAWFGVTVENNRVTHLYLAENGLNGSIPYLIGNLTGLESLTLRENMLSGPIPASVGKLAALIELKLSKNQLNGGVPEEIGDLSELTLLRLHDNQLEGEVPASIWNMTQLKEIWLSENNLSGSVPSTIGELVDLKWLNLGNNQFTGPLPAEINNLTQLTNVYLRYNQFTGPLPEGFGNCPKLRELFAQGNQFEGSIPSTYGNMGDCVQMDLSDNLLTGSIPPELGNLSNLVNLYLNDNSLDGHMPSQIFQISGLRAIYLHRNQLEGEIPKEIGQCPKLQYLFLYDNQFSGNFPVEIVQDTSLKRIFIHDNQFTSLPDLSSLKYLDDLRLDGNQLTFEDLEPNAGIATYHYSPQDSVGEEQTLDIEEGGTLTLTVDVGGSATEYQWIKDGVNIEGADDATYQIEAVTLSDEGSYTCVITNTILELLTLYSRPVVVTVQANTEISDVESVIPSEYKLLQNYPNPFNPETVIRFDVMEPCDVMLTVYNVLGQQIRILINEKYQPGEYDFILNSSDLESGLYIYQIRMGNYQAMKKMVVME